jgi:hypothetical protein
MITLVLKPRAQRHEWFSETAHMETAMARSTPVSLTTIARQLDVNDLPTLTKPLPSELKDLIAQLVALESGKRGWTELSPGDLRSAIAQPRPQS